jgi:prepilin-type N-terminal cleavage/methylation domain-containing protein
MKMRKKGFTLIELLVVVSIIAMLLAILMPALNKVKKIAMRVVCATNLKGLGTAETVYCQDYDDEYTIQGQGNTNLTWSDRTTGFQKTITESPWSSRTEISIGASLYLLVREADVTPDSFVCPSGDEKAYEGQNDFQLDLVELWDFGFPGYQDTGPVKCVSYSYHMPYVGGTGSGSGARGTFAADGTRSASFAMMADKNPYFDQNLSKGGLANDLSNYQNVVSLIGGSSAPTEGTYESLQKELTEIGNAYSHDRTSQNVLFADGHVSNEKRADVGSRNDNVYTMWSDMTTEAGRRRGVWPDSVANFQPVNKDDSVLVNDGPLTTKK